MRGARSALLRDADLELEVVFLRLCKPVHLAQTSSEKKNTEEQNSFGLWSLKSVGLVFRKEHSNPGKEESGFRVCKIMRVGIEIKGSHRDIKLCLLEMKKK